MAQGGPRSHLHLAHQLGRRQGEEIEGSDVYDYPFHKDSRLRSYQHGRLALVVEGTSVSIGI